MRSGKVFAKTTYKLKMTIFRSGNLINERYLILAIWLNKKCHKFISFVNRFTNVHSNIVEMN